MFDFGQFARALGIWQNERVDLGILNYHLRAFRHRSMWTPFRDVVASVLRPEFFVDRRVCLVGPSLGYVLPLQALTGAKSFVILDRDRIVTQLLPRKLRSQFEQRRADVVSDVRTVRTHLHTTGGLELLAKLKGSDTIFVFCNVLGQLKYSWLEGMTGSETDFAERFSYGKRWFGSLRNLLDGVHWVSLHDRISFADSTPVGDLPRAFVQGRRLGEEALFGVIRPVSKNSDVLKSFESHWMDFWELDHGPFVYAPWKLAVARTQWIEFASSKNINLSLGPKG